MSDEQKVKGVVVEATAVASPAVDDENEKRGKKCCNCCCDFRRAVVVASVVIIVYSTIMTIFFASYTGITANAAVNAEPDSGMGIFAGFAVILGIAAFLFAMGIGFGVFQLMGALRYNVCVLTTCLVFHCLNLVLTTVSSWYLADANSTGGYGPAIAAAIVTPVVYTTIWIYPLAGLLKEIKGGILTEETYPREAYSCCCAPDV